MITFLPMKHFEQENVQAEKKELDISWIKRDLRYILTQKCNYNCSFCHKEWCDGSEKNLLNADDYDFIFSTAKDALWIRQVTLSGGEPMTRNDIWTIAQKLHESGAKVTMVSNGALISKHPETMKHIDILNLSLHTTEQEIYTTITWSHTKVKDLINEIAHIHQQYPHLQIKLNSAIIKNQNIPGSQDFIQKCLLAQKYWWKLKYLELSEKSIPGFVDLKDFEQWLIDNGFIKNHTTARQSFFKKWTIEVITGKVFCAQAKETKDPQAYCKQYNDIYVTPDWYLSGCPLDIKKFSAYEAIISRNSKQLASLFHDVVDTNSQYQCPFIQ